MNANDALHFSNAEYGYSWATHGKRRDDRERERDEMRGRQLKPVLTVTAPDGRQIASMSRVIAPYDIAERRSARWRRRVSEFFKDGTTRESTRHGFRYFSRHAFARRRLMMSCTILLIALSGVDGHFHPDEIRVLVRSLRKEFHLSRRRVRRLIARALRIFERGDSPRLTHRSLRAIDQSVARGLSKPRLFSIATELALADGSLDPNEIELLRQMVSALRLSKDQCAGALREAKQFYALAILEQPLS